MDLQSKFDKLRIDYIDNDQFLKDMNACVTFMYQEYDGLKKLLQNAYDDIDNRDNNIKIMIDNLPFILKYTTAHNIAWLGYRELVNNNDFINKFIDSLKCFPYPQDRGRLFYELLDKNDDSLFNRRMFEELFISGLNNNYYSLLFNKLSSNKKEMFLDVALEKKISLNFKNYKINGFCYYYFRKHIEEFLNLSNDMLSMTNIFKHDEEALEIVNNYYRNHFSLIGQAIINESHLRKYNNEVKELIQLIVEDIVRNREALASDIYWLEGGAYSEILVIKDKVIKLGDDRDTEVFPNNPYIMAPLLRKKFNLGGQDIFIEVTELGDAFEEFSYDECYEVYKRFRRIGLVAADMHDMNLAVLKKDNVIHWNGNLKPSDNELMLEEYRGNEVLKAGDIVLIDGDSIFKEGDPELTFEHYPFYHQYETEYQKELSLR